MADTEVSDAAVPMVLFKSKKRKHYRQRAASPEDEAARSETPIFEAPPLSPTSLRSTPSLAQDERANAFEEDGLNLQEILRMRKLRKHRVGGVEFGATPPPQNNISQELVPVSAAVQEQEEGGLNVVKRFVSRAGTSVEGVDKHMMAYIDSKLAERCNPTATTTSTSIFDKPRSDGNKNQYESVPPKTTAPQRETLSQRKIQEIELTEDPTEAARNRVINKTPINAVQEPKPRIGRNGKPYIPRNRNRRTSEELRRDALVDAVLTENTLEYYGQPTSSIRGGGNAEAGNDEDADEEMAERFRREFEEASSERKRTRPVAPPVQKSGYGQKDEEVLKGPKLGGSRMQRQAMRETLLKAEKDKWRK